MAGEIGEKEFPFRRSPKIGLFVVVKANQEGGDEIEFFSEIGEGNKGQDTPDHAAYTQQSGDFSEHGNVVDVEAEHVVAEQLCDVGEIAGAAAEIENPLRTRQIELDLADAANVDVDPTIKIEILGPIFAGVFDPVLAMNRLELCGINCLDDAFGG